MNIYSKYDSSLVSVEEYERITCIKSLSVILGFLLS